MTYQSTANKIKALGFSLLVLILMACGAADTKVTNPPTITSEAFPINFAIASPLASTDSSLSSQSGFLRYQTDGDEPEDFDSVVAKINEILEADSIDDCSIGIDARRLLNFSADAACYGPLIDYENHPDGTLPNSGTLPTGDTGLWRDTDPVREEACAAAQLNVQLNEAKDQTLTILQFFAAMHCLITNDAALELPEVSETLDLAGAMSSLFENNTEIDAITEATITQVETTSLRDTINFPLKEITLDDNSFQYRLSLVFIDNEGNSHDVRLTLDHTNLSSGYLGKITSRFDFKGANQDNCSTEDETKGMSLSYYLKSDSELWVRLDKADHCGAGVDPFAEAPFIDPANVASTDNPGGWGNRYTIFTAVFDPSTRAGSYTYAWQAGENDSHQRLLNVVLDATTPASGTGFFGFSESVVTNTKIGVIDGFICNWVGPGNDHTLKNLVQKQTFEFDEATGRFVVLDSFIRYAPTNACSYDGKGSFQYDSDGDGTIDTEPDDVIDTELVALDLDDGNEIEKSGFNLADETFFESLVK